ncbi:hypothetical protein ACLI09_03315 [Flavobacterium sp. RHBU_24]|uniref:hypothetical protein n=1 Tax=Flavobacterium sp. RHBU_24 TaxID=3391185 RepID=UPI0039855740
MLLNDDFTILEVLIAVAFVYLVSVFIIKRISLKRKEEILNRYSSLRRQSLKLQKTLSQHVLTESTDALIPQGQVSYADFYRQLKSNHVYNLSDKQLSKVKNTNNLLFLSKAERNLQEQEQKLKNAEQLISGTLVLQ